MTTSASPRRAALAGLAVVLLAVVGAGARAADAEPARFALDPEHLTIAFLVEHIGYAKTLGTFRKASGGGPPV